MTAPATATAVEIATALATVIGIAPGTIAFHGVVGAIEEAVQAGRKLERRMHLCPMDIGPALDQSCAEAMAEGARAEREAVVSWLRQSALKLETSSRSRALRENLAHLMEKGAIRGREEEREALRPIDRFRFLHARMAYLASLRADGESPAQMMVACNLGDEGQVQLLLMTWDDMVRARGEGGQQ